MTVHRLVPQNIELVFSDTEAGLTTDPDYTCQIQNATVQPKPTYTTLAATGCQAATQSLDMPVPEDLMLTYVQDWTAPGGGLSNYSRVNAGAIKWFQYVPDPAFPELTVKGQVQVIPDKLGGDMGKPSIAGPVAWPIQGTATVTVPADVVAATAAEQSAAEQFADEQFADAV